MEQQRSKFSGKLGFVLAAAGSAVGLGNIWRFPYLAAKYGGGAFLVTYILLVVTLGFTIMIAETALGRKTGLSPIGAYRALKKKYAFVGVLAALVGYVILSYYSVIGGWVIKYFAGYLTGQAAAMAQPGYFSDFVGQTWQPILWQFVFVGLTFLIIIRGVKGGIERVSKILMPILVVLSIGISVYSICLPGAMDGVKYLFWPDFSHFSIQTVLAAMGQMFYSMSLAMGIMITYGSYLRKEDNLEGSVKQIEIFDTGIAILAALMIIPAVFAFSGGDQAELGQGPSLMFVTLPKVFDGMPFGGVVGGAFFLLVFFAALTSAIALFETTVSTVCDEWHWSRKKASLTIGITTFLLGIPSSLGNGIWSGFKILGFQFLDFLDFITNSVMMPVGAFLTCIFVGFVIKPKIICDEVELSSPFQRKRMFEVMVKYIAPICIAAILVSSVLNAFGIVVI